MRFSTRLESIAKKNDSLVCVGLDSDSTKLPKHLKGVDRIFVFNRAIIEATADLVCAYKPNSAFYEALGARGIEQLKKTCDYIRRKYPSVQIILDAKRADIGNTNDAYAKFAFDYLGADAITLHPYLGGEALQPFLDHKDKGLIILCRTSNPGAGELQDLRIGGEKLYKTVAKKVRESWNQRGNCLLVVGATYPKELAEIRKLMGDDFTFLVPGIGTQGGDLRKTLKAGINSKKGGLIISSSREILFGSSGKDFAQVARQKTMEMRDIINMNRG